MDDSLPTIDDLERARARLEGVAHRTPVHTSRTLDARVGAAVFLKCENLQRAGAFKFRGAWNAVASLAPEVAARGVVTHSSGNHGQALALAARERGIPATVVVPEGAPESKRAAIAGYGARVVGCPNTQADRERVAREVLEGTGGALVHPYDDPRVIAGQGSAAAELLEEEPDLDLLLVPVGGGGLAAGTLLAARAHPGRPRVIGVEPAAADDAARSLAGGQRITWDRAPETVADGLRTALSPRTFRALREGGAEVVTVTEAAILGAMRFLGERCKLVVEPSGAVPVAALLSGALPGEGRRIGVILSGGNVDLDRFR